jgi:L-iditol 2-dehydrogenase
MSRALFLHRRHDARVAPYDLREGRPGEVLLEVAAVGLCGSDLHYYKDGGIGAAAISAPFVPGHEFAGWLAQDVSERDLHRGTLVAVDPNQACGACRHCRAGHPNLCPDVRFIGAPPHDGAMTSRIWIDRDLIVPVPTDFSPVDAVMLEPLGVAIHAVDLAKPRLLESVTVLGCGPIGLLIIQVLRFSGVRRIAAVDPQGHRRDLAARMGAARTAASLADLQSPDGAPLVIEATNSPDGFRDAVRATAIGGRVVLVGIPDGDTYQLPASEARRRGLSIKFSRRMGHVYPRAIELVSGGHVDVRSLVSHNFSLEEAPDAFRRHANNEPGMVKSIILPQAGWDDAATTSRHTGSQ